MRKGKFCPKCGKSVEELYEGLCKDCFQERMKLPKDLPEKLSVGTCKVCGNIFLNEKKFETVEGAIESFLEKVLEEKNVMSATYRISGGKLYLTVKMKVNDIEKEMEKRIELVNKTITCGFCNLQKSKFYNATIQIRVPKNMEDEIVVEVENKIKEINRYDNYAFISDIQKLKEGVDLFVGSKNVAEEIANYMKRKYNAKIKVSRKLYGLSEGKKVYRDTILVSISD